MDLRLGSGVAASPQQQFECGAQSASPSTSVLQPTRLPGEASRLGLLPQPLAAVMAQL